MGDLIQVLEEVVDVDAGHRAPVQIKTIVD